MTRFSKILVIFLTVAALAFMGFAAAARYGGTNWIAESHADGLADYSIKLLPGEEPKWEVKYRRGDKNTIATTPVLPEALTKAYQHSTQQLMTRKSEIATDLAGQQSRLEATTKLSEIDDASLKARVGELSNAVKNLESANVKLSNTLTQKSRRTTATRAEAADRREDVIRLSDELETLETDVERLTKKERTLTDQLIQFKILNQSLSERRDQLVEQSGQQTDDGPTLLR